MYLIDAHVHARDEEESHKETIPHLLKVAESVGVCAVFDMPNTKVPVTTLQRVLQRLKIAEHANSPVHYSTFIALTNDPEQVKQAVDIYKNLHPHAIGFKYFTTHHTDELNIASFDSQVLLYTRLAKNQFRGVVVPHSEKHSMIDTSVWDPSRPWTHMMARPEYAETESVCEQIEAAVTAGYKGKIHFPHVTSPKSVRIIKDGKKYLNLSCGVTPADLLLNPDVYNKPDGIMFKKNPPIRRYANELTDLLISGDIDIIETDHAPHTFEEQQPPMCYSGIVQLPFYPVFIPLLQKKGLSDKRLKEVTNTRVRQIFDFDLPENKLNKGANYSDDYCFNPYKYLN